MVAVSELTQCRFFSDFSGSEVASLASIAALSHWKEGETVFVAGAPATNLYILKSGIILLYFPQGRSLVIREPGEAIGWSTFMAPFRYTGSALCLTDVDLFLFPNMELFRRIRMNTNLGHRLMQKISLVMEQRKPYRYGSALGNDQYGDWA